MMGRDWDNFMVADAKHGIARKRAKGHRTTYSLHLCQVLREGLSMRYFRYLFCTMPEEWDLSSVYR